MRIYEESDASKGVFTIYRNTSKGPSAASTCLYCCDPRKDAEIFQKFITEYREALEKGAADQDSALVEVRKPPAPWMAVIRWKGSDPKITAMFERAVFVALAGGARETGRVPSSPKHS
jgi:hypothetical protein